MIAMRHPLTVDAEAADATLDALLRAIAAPVPRLEHRDSGTVIRYSTTSSAEADGSTRSCCLREFEQIDTVWELAHPNADN